MSHINWKLIAFWVALFWCVYSAPTEGSLFLEMMSASSGTTQADTF